MASDGQAFSQDPNEPEDLMAKLEASLLPSQVKRLTTQVEGLQSELELQRANARRAGEQRDKYLRALQRIAAAPTYFEYDNQRSVANSVVVTWAREAIR